MDPTYAYVVYTRILEGNVVVSVHMGEVAALKIAQRIADGIRAYTAVSIGSFRSIHARCIDKDAHNYFDVSVERIEIDDEYLVKDAIDAINLRVQLMGSNK